jgi:hypothetical protein
VLTFLTMKLLSLRTLDGPRKGIPKHFNLIRNAETMSSAMRMATSLEPYVLDSQVFCFLLKTYISVLLIKMVIPLCKRLVTLFPAWSEWTKQVIKIGAPSGGGIL